MIYIGVLPYDKPFVTSTGFRLFITDYVEDVAIHFGGDLGTIIVLKYFKSLLLDHFGKPILFDGKTITHNDVFIYVSDCIKNHKRLKKLERLCK